MNTWLIFVPLLALAAAKPPLPQKVVPIPSLTCANIKCGYYGACAMKDNMPVCTCEKSCDNEEEEQPFCDVEGTEYRSLCDVQKRICEAQNYFFYLPGKCKGCKDSEGVEMEHNLVRPPMKGQLCLEEKCNHGSIVKRMNGGCLNKLGYMCTIGDEEINDLECADGFSCHVTKWSDEPEKYPHLGICKKQKIDKCYFQGKEHDLNSKFISPDCKSNCLCKGWNQMECVSLCPPVDLSCEPDEIKEIKLQRVGDSECKCRRPVCTKKTVLCAMKPDSGPCYAYFRKWRYDPETKGCKQFVYGGCHGNGNRFDTKVECEKACKPEPVPIAPISDIKKFSPRRDFRWPRPKPKQPILSDIDMTVKGKIRFNGVKKILPNPSCLFVVLSDISLMDVPSITIFSQRFDLSGYDTSKDFDYTMSGKKPGKRQLWRSYSLSAYIYLKRCPDVRQSVNKGDFLTDTVHSVQLSEANSDYDKDVNVICYDCKPQEPKENLPARDTKITSEESNENKSKKILLKPGCQFESKFYKVGQEFANRDCTGSCTCQKSGKVLCVSLCPPKEIECNAEQKIVTINIPSSLDPRCQCSEQLCANKELNEDECVVQGEVHKINDTFVSKDCLGVCRCDQQLGFGCVSLCPPMGVMCGPGEIKEMYKERTSRPECFCDREMCIPAPPVVMKAPPKILEGNENEEDDENEELIIEGDESMYGGGVAYNVTLEKEKKVVIKGMMVLPEHINMFPKHSCLLIKISDVSIADASSFTVSKVTQDLSGVILNNTEMELLVKTPKPVEKDLGRMYSLAVVLFRGRCGKQRNEIGDGDYYTDAMNDIIFSNDTDEIKMEDILLRKYETFVPDELEEMEVWPMGEGPDVQLEKNRTIDLNGRITFKKELGKLSNGSCIRFRFEDVSLMDASAFLVKETRMDMSGVEIKDEYKFKFSAPKPIEEDLHEQFAISATLFVGWCPENGRFRENDWYTDTIFNVALTKENDNYDDIEMFLKENVKTPKQPKIKNDDTAVPMPTNASKICYDKATNNTLEEGEIIKINDCEYCECRDGKVSCAEQICPSIACDSGVMIKKEGECCPECVPPPPPKECYVKETNTTYKHGSNFKLDPCTACMCEDGEKRCAVQDCARPNCRNPITKPGECCPVCEKEECYDKETQRAYKNNEMWVQADGCTRCYCFQNQPMCATPMCYLEKCDDGVDHINVKGICCPVCANKQVCRTQNGRTFIQGRVWHDDQCQLCRCTADGIKCEVPNRDKENCIDGHVVQLSRECGKICLKHDKNENEEEDDDDDYP